MSVPDDREPRAARSGAEGGIWSPLRNRLFATLILVNLFAQLGAFMNGLGAAWVLTDITDSPAVISALQVAVAVPVFLLALITGALADIISRKRIIVFAQTGSVGVAGAFALLSATGNHTVVSILGLTATLGVFSALAAPAWIAIIPGLVSRADLAGAMTLSSAGINMAMALGPAIAGFIIAAAGPTWVFVLNAVILIGGLVALRTWRPKDRAGLPGEHLGSAIRVGLQYVRYDRPLKVVIAKILPFALIGVALVSLLPAIARFRLDAGPAMFGVLSGAGGVGAILALIAMPRVRRVLGQDTIVFGALLIDAFVFLALAATTNLVVSVVVLTLAGAATLALVSTVMTALQVILPAWVRGRGVAVYLLALQGAFAIGALIWGGIAERVGLEATLYAAGIAMGLSALATLFLRLERYADVNTAAAELLHQPITATSVHDDDGPILLTARWRIDAGRRSGFLAAMQPVRKALRSKGALSWHLAEDVQEPGVMLESFTMATWSEYQRLPGRVTVTDKDLEAALEHAAGGELPALSVYRVIDVRGGQAHRSDPEASDSQ